MRVHSTPVVSAPPCIYCGQRDGAGLVKVDGYGSIDPRAWDIEEAPESPESMREASDERQG